MKSKNRRFTLWVPGVIPLLLLLAFAPRPVAAETEYTTITVQGRGTSNEDAVANALTEAIRQVNGLALDTISQTDLNDMQEDLQQDEESRHKASTMVKTSDRTQLKTRGVIKSYKINACARESDGTWLAKVTAVVAQYKPVDTVEDGKVKIAVIPFGRQAKSFSVGSQQLDSATVADNLQGNLNQTLTQSRKFIVLSRTDDQALNKERERILANASIDEWVKQGQQIGADYLLCGNIRDLHIAPEEERTIAISGATVRSPSRGTLEFDYRLVNSSTARMVWAGTFSLDFSPEEIQKAGGTIQSVYRLLLMKSAEVTGKIVENILYRRLEGIDENGEIRLGSGAAIFPVGTRYEVVSLDSIRNLSRTYPRKGLATIVVTSAGKTDAKAKLIEGTGPLTPGDIAAGCFAFQEVSDARTGREPSPDAPRKAPVVKLPFDP